MKSVMMAMIFLMTAVQANVKFKGILNVKVNQVIVLSWEIYQDSFC